MLQGGAADAGGGLARRRLLARGVRAEDEAAAADAAAAHQEEEEEGQEGQDEQAGALSVQRRPIIPGGGGPLAGMTAALQPWPRWQGPRRETVGKWAALQAGPVANRCLQIYTETDRLSHTQHNREHAIANGQP